MLVVFGSSNAGFGMEGYISFGVLEKMLVTPVNRYGLVLGWILGGSLSLAISVILIIAIGCLMGVSIAMGILGVILALLVVLLLGLGFVGISYGIVIRTKDTHPLVIITSMINLPLIFLSSALMPVNFMPGWISSVARVNPVNYAVEAIRTLFIECNWNTYLLGLLVTGLFACIGLALTIESLKKFGE